jgi:hypothetical protein
MIWALGFLASFFFWFGALVALALMITFIICAFVMMCISVILCIPGRIVGLISLGFSHLAMFVIGFIKKHYIRETVE